MISTGVKGLDDVITGLKLGDNVVWQIDDIKDYAQLVNPFVEQALKEKRNVVYIRFALHKEILKPTRKIKRYELNPNAGFESFTTKLHNIIAREGEGTYYVFDCLSELLSDWAADLMIGNFFRVTCPYLYDLKTVTYFAILRNNHSFKCIARIRETTQLLIDVYRSKGSFYIHPLKVWNRYSPTMFLPHQKKADSYIPITDSVNTVNILSYIRKKGTESAKRNLDFWDRLFMKAEELIKSAAPKNKKEAMVRKLNRIMLTKNKKIMSLTIRNFSLQDLLDIKSKLIGTGFIGGKTVGMLLARKILSKDKSINWEKFSEAHDSFYIGSDIFYSYIVENQLWKLRMQQKTEKGYFSAAKILQKKILKGVFSDEIKEKIQQVIEYFGASPIIIRSSSLLEDGFGNAFAGKYESIFLANQGSPEQRYAQFAEAVRLIYASTMSEDALVYRKQRKLDKLDEQMALLVQRVSGAYHKHYFFPDLAGVGVSYNTYVWNENMDRNAGMLRLVFGLGTRAVNRVEGDYPRMVALDAPLQRPYSQRDDLKRFSQHKVDLIDIKNNKFAIIPFEKIIDEKLYNNINRLAVRDYEAMRIRSEMGKGDEEQWILTFDELFTESNFADSFKNILKTLQKNYNYPVEIEFTLNFAKDNDFKINLLQCRPLQTWGVARGVDMPGRIKTDNILFKSQGCFLGGNSSLQIKRIIYVDKTKYARLIQSSKYQVARLVGELNRQIKDRKSLPTLLIGPGRWGTTTPSLGIPVKFAEINNISVLVEVASSEDNLMPELSFGTHFFQDLVETNIFYIALFPGKKNVCLREKWFAGSKNIFPKLIPQFLKYKDIIAVYDVQDKDLKIISDVVSQKLVCFSKYKKKSKSAAKITA